MPNQRHRRGGAGACVNGFDAHGVGHLLRVTVPAEVEFGWDAGGFEVGVSCHRARSRPGSTAFPLLIARTSHGDFATSDIAAVADWVDEFQVLEDGDVVDLTGTNRWHTPGVNGVLTAMTRCIWRGRDADLNGYADYMAKDIDEQPKAAARVPQTT